MHRDLQSRPGHLNGLVNADRRGFLRYTWHLIFKMEGGTSTRGVERKRMSSTILPTASLHNLPFNAVDARPPL